MPLATYADLKVAVAEWANRNDLNPRIPDFITLAESRIERELRVRQLVKSTSGTLSGQTLAAPSDFVEVASFRLPLVPLVTLEYRPPQDLYARVGDGAAGIPQLYTVVGSSFVLWPAPDSAYAYALDYYATMPRISDTVTPALYALAPGLYLHGALLQIAPYLGDDDRIAIWAAQYEAEKQALRAMEQRSRGAGTLARVRVA